MKFLYGLQIFASKKGVSSTKNGRDSHSKRLGAKVAQNQKIKAGNIIYRQRGTKIYPGLNVKKGVDDTLYATKSGYVFFQKFKNNKKKVSVLMEKNYSLRSTQPLGSKKT